MGKLEVRKLNGEGKMEIKSTMFWCSLLQESDLEKDK